MHGAIESEEVTQGHTVDALAPGGEEGRANLRKVPARWYEPLTRKYPNGATHWE